MSKHKKLLKGRLLYVEGLNHWAAQGNKILQSDDAGKNWFLFAEIDNSIIYSLCSKFRLSARLLRVHIDYLVPLEDRVIVFGFKKIFVFDMQGRQISVQSVIGSKPLSICRVNDIIFYGEYRSNPERSNVNIFSSDDCGRTWSSVWEFSGVRHVHGVYFDPYDDVIWVTTGDSDVESAIWCTTNRFKTLEKIIFGSQKTRAVQLLFDKQFVYYGSDAPGERNYIYRINKNTHVLERLESVGNSVFFGCKVGSSLFFSTAVEPSDVNRSCYVEIWCSLNGFDWNMIYSLKKDIYSMKYFQYGQIFFPGGEGDGEYLWFTPNGTDKDNFICNISLSRLQDEAL